MSLFVHNFGGEFIVLLIYVDDIVLTSNNPGALPKLLVELGRLFAMKDLGPIHYFLGIEAYRVDSDLYLTQTTYIWDLLRQTNMQDAKPIESPVESNSLNMLGTHYQLHMSIAVWWGFYSMLH